MNTKPQTKRVSLQKIIWSLVADVPVIAVLASRLP